ncbi:MAG: MFS transporter [Proteobacteria bacterium]|nr:MFS transporter [Pseudomonadota bacterium]
MISAKDVAEYVKSLGDRFFALKNRNFRLLWIGTLASFNARQMLIVARGWLIYTMTDSALALGIVAASMGVPIVMFSLFGGAIADRVRKKNLLLAAQFTLFATTLVITILIVTDRIAIWQLVIAAFLVGTVFAFNMPARQAFLVEVVDQDTVTNAIALNSVAMNFCRVASPALAGILITFIGIPGVYLLVAVSNGLAMISLSFITSEDVLPERSDVSIVENVLTGLRYVRNNTIILKLLIVAFVPVIVATPYRMLMPVFAKTVFSGGETTLGILLSAGGVGALSGSAMIALLGDFKRKGMLMFLAGSVFGASLILFSLVQSLVLAFICLLFCGAGSSMLMILTNTLIMTHTPKELIGRVMSLFVLIFGIMPLAMAPAGALAEFYGAAAVVTVGGGISLVFIFIMMMSQPHIRRLK